MKMDRREITKVLVSLGVGFACESAIIAILGANLPGPRGMRRLFRICGIAAIGSKVAYDMEDYVYKFLGKIFKASDDWKKAVDDALRQARSCENAN